MVTSHTVTKLKEEGIRVVFKMCSCYIHFGALCVFSVFH